MIIDIIDFQGILKSVGKAQLFLFMSKFVDVLPRLKILQTVDR